MPASLAILSPLWRIVSAGLSLKFVMCIALYMAPYSAFTQILPISQTDLHFYVSSSYLTIQTAVLADIVIPLMSPSLQMAVFADIVLPLMSPTLQMAAFADKVLPQMSPSLRMAAFADNVLLLTRYIHFWCMYTHLLAKYPTTSNAAVSVHRVKEGPRQIF